MKPFQNLFKKKKSLSIGLLFMIVMVGVQGCKTTRVLPSKKPIEKIELKTLRKKIIKNYPSYKNLRLRIKARYDNGKRNQQLTLQLRMQDGKAIWLSANMLIPIAKMLIKPNEVSFYEKFEKRYFKGDFELLNTFLKAEVDFKKVENLLLGIPVSDLGKGKWKRISNPQYYIVAPDMITNQWQPSFFFDPSDFLLKEQRIFIPESQQQISVKYLTHQQIEGTKIPRNIEIVVFNGETVQKLHLEYTRATLPRTITMPFAIPEGYRKIKL